jgi:hypothetical protein
MWFTRHKSFAMAIGVGFAAVVLVFVAIIPLYQNSTTISGKSTQNLEARFVCQSIDTFKTRSKCLEGEVTVLDSALPPRKDILLYLTSIDRLSRAWAYFWWFVYCPGDITEASGSAKPAKAADFKL